MPPLFEGYPDAYTTQFGDRWTLTLQLFGDKSTPTRGAVIIIMT